MRIPVKIQKAQNHVVRSLLKDGKYEPKRLAYLVKSEFGYPISRDRLKALIDHKKPPAKGSQEKNNPYHDIATIQPKYKCESFIREIVRDEFRKMFSEN